LPVMVELACMQNRDGCRWHDADGRGGSGRRTNFTHRERKRD